MLLALIVIANCYKEDPHEYESEGISHIDYEKDQMPIKLERGEGSPKVKRMVIQEPVEYESESIDHIDYENNQTPAEDRNSWQVRPKVKRMSAKGGKKVHIYLKNDDHKSPRGKKSASASTTTTTTTTFKPTEENFHKDTETQTRRAPELTTKSDADVRKIRYADKDSISAGSSHSKLVGSRNQQVDSHTEASDISEHVINEKIKIKHHHHHHHHNHVKTVVKKEPYPVEKIVHVPYEKVVEKFIEKKVPYKVEVPVEKIVEKVFLMRDLIIGNYLIFNEFQRSST